MSELYDIMVQIAKDVVRDYNGSENISFITFKGNGEPIPIIILKTKNKETKLVMNDLEYMAAADLNKKITTRVYESIDFLVGD